MAAADQPEFDSIEDELDYWKDFANTCLNEKRLIQKEFDDYTEQSSQLEKELEATLEQAEKSNKTLKIEKVKLQNEIESLKSRLDQSSRDLTTFQNEISTLKSDFQKHTAYIRELEQKNDDLERGQRILLESLTAKETTLNTAIERNALLESEVDEKEQLQVKFQRLLDETRDLKEDMSVKDRKLKPDNEQILNNDNTIDSNRLLSEKDSLSQAQTPTKRDPTLSTTLNGSPMMPSARHSALNLVSDILRKMGSLEAKVQTCRQRQYSQNLEHRYRRLNRAAANNATDAPLQSAMLHRDV